MSHEAHEAHEALSDTDDAPRHKARLPPLARLFPSRYASIAPSRAGAFEYERRAFDHDDGEGDHSDHSDHSDHDDHDDDAGAAAPVSRRRRRTSLLAIRVPDAGDVDGYRDGDGDGDGYGDGEFGDADATPTPHALMNIPREAHAGVVPADVLDAPLQADARGLGAGSVIRAGAGSVFPESSGARAYELLRPIGAGAFSCVWLGQEVAGAEAGWPVAVKMIARAREKRGHGHRWGKRARASFLREAEMLKVRLPLSSLPFPPSLTDPPLTHACSRTKTAPVYPHVPLPAHAACHACARDAPHACAQARAWQRALRRRQLGCAARVHAPLHMDGAG